jgi:uncharacterized protein YndB with AHSA1/START domain
MTEKEPITLTVKHRFSASAERVYDAWLDPERASKFFFATATGQIVRCEIDARVGGRFTIVDRRDGEDAEHVGTFLELERPKRIVFEFKVEKYSQDSSRVAIDIAAQREGCELTITHTIDRKHAEYRGRTERGWAKILEQLDTLEGVDPETCGQGVAQHADLPAKIARVFATLAETLEGHRAMIVKGTGAAAKEDDAYRDLAKRYRELAELTSSAAAAMESYRDLPPVEHDESAYGEEQRSAFERWVEAQSDLLATLKIAAPRDERMLKQISKSG